jgi:hypothetical protein
MRRAAAICILAVIFAACLPFTAQARMHLYWVPSLTALTNMSKADAVTDDAGVTPLATGDTAIVIASSRTYHYQYDSTSTATEASPSVLAPYDAGASGRWLLSGSDAPTDLALRDNTSATCGLGELRLYTVGGVWKKCANGVESLLSGSGSADLTTPGPIGATTPSTGSFTTLTAVSFDISPPPTGETSELALQEDPANGNNVVTLKAPASIPADVTFRLPSGDGTAGQALTTNGAGALSFATVAPVAAPANAASACAAGNWAYDSAYIYVCVAANTWLRAAIATW